MNTCLAECIRVEETDEITDKFLNLLQNLSDKGSRDEMARFPT